MLENLKAMVENANEDVQVLRSAIQTAASIYPLVMRWMYVSFHPSPPSLPPSNPDASSPPPPPPGEARVRTACLASSTFIIHKVRADSRG